MRKLFLILIILLFLPFVNGAITEIESDSFPYSDGFVNHGWVYSGGGCGDFDEKATAEKSPFTTNSFAYNGTNNGCGDYARSIEKPFAVNITSGSPTLSYSYYLENDSVISGNVPMILHFQNQSFSGERITLEHGRDGETYRVVCGTQSGCETCFHSNFTTPKIIDNSVLQVNFETNKYTWLIDGSSGFDCSGKDIGSIKNFGAIQIIMRIDADENFSSFFDNYAVVLDGDLAETNETLGVASPCENDGQCLTLNCQDGYCQEKVGGRSCINDIECISNNCINSKCTKPSLWAGIDASKTELAGDDEATNNFIALIFILGIPIMFIFMAGKNGVLPAVLGFYLLGIFFTMVGWLSVFLLLGFIVGGLVLFVFVTLLHGKGD